MAAITPVSPPRGRRLYSDYEERNIVKNLVPRPVFFKDAATGEGAWYVPEGVTDLTPYAPFLEPRVKGYDVARHVRLFVPFGYNSIVTKTGAARFGGNFWYTRKDDFPSDLLPFANPLFLEVPYGREKPPGASFDGVAKKWYIIPEYQDKDIFKAWLPKTALATAPEKMPAATEATKQHDVDDGVTKITLPVAGSRPYEPSAKRVKA